MYHQWLRVVYGEAARGEASAADAIEASRAASPYIHIMYECMLCMYILRAAPYRSRYM